MNNWVRGICHLGMMPANGLLYAPPEPCKCYWYERVSDFCAMASAQPPAAQLAPTPIKINEAPKGPEAGSGDWPTFRADTARSGHTQGHVSVRISPAWRTELGSRLSAPIAVGNRVYVSAIDSHTLNALDAETGKLVWRHIADGRVDSPPTYAEGKLVFGDSHGRVTCLRASDGGGVWASRAAPADRLIGVHGQLESAWPVNGSVLVSSNTVYVAAGRSSYLDGGIHLYGLDLDTGRVLHHTSLQGPDIDLDNEKWFDGYNDMGGRGALADILQLCGDSICMRNRAFDCRLKPVDIPPHIQPMGGFLDDTYFKRYFWFYGTPMVRPVYAAMAKPKITPEQMKIALGQLLVQDDSAIYGMRMFDSMKLLNANNYFVPGKDGYLIFRVPPGEGEPAWTQRVPIRVTAMASTADHLVIAGPPDIVDPDDPLGAFEARKGGHLRILSKKDGTTLAAHELKSPTVFNGMAVAQGRLVLTLDNGKVVSFADPRED